MISTCEIASVKKRYFDYLCSNVAIRTNRLRHYQDNYSPEQKHIHTLIKSLHDDGLSYRRITKHLNEKSIRAHKVNRWSETGSSVYSVLKRYKERVERLAEINKEYEPVWGKMEIRWEKK